MNKLYLVILWVFAALPVMSQSHLDKKVSVHADQVALEQVLAGLESDYDFQFSYNSSLIDLHANRVTIHLEDVPLSVVLDKLIPFEAKYVVRGSYLIIQDQKKQSRHKHRYRGQIYDSKSKKPLNGVSVYTLNSMDADLTNDGGAFDLGFKEDHKTVQLAFSRENYKDTIIQIEGSYTGRIDISMEPLYDSTLFDNKNSAADSLSFVRFMAGRQSISHMKNVQFFQEKNAQVSFLPFLGSNKLFSGKTKNHVSLNVLAGYSHSISGVEVGGFANIVRQDVHGLQIAGFGNVVGRETKGIQVAGGFNVNKRKVEGIQLAGFMNTVVDTFVGFQGSGFVNVGPYTKGVQLSGFVNTTWAGSEALQCSGFMNYTKSNSGAQFTGFVNFALKEHVGIQASGFLNYAGSSQGVQMAGLTNISVGVTKGLQIASLLNVAQKLNGVQIGMINLCDTVESGVSIGLLNIVRKGVFEPELYYSDFGPYNFRLKTGTNQFYNILGLAFQEELELLLLGYGLGSRYIYDNNVVRGVELQSNWVLNPVDARPQQLNLLNSFYPFIGYKFHKHLALSGGPVVNIYVNRYKGADPLEYGYPILKMPFYNVTDQGTNVQMSIGYRVGLSF
jgi:hypothetical protein